MHEREDNGLRGERREKREERREVDYAAACCHALCCLVLWTIYLLFEAFDLPQWFHVCFLLLVAVSSTFAAVKPYLMCKRET